MSNSHVFSAGYLHVLMVLSTHYRVSYRIFCFFWEGGWNNVSKHLPVTPPLHKKSYFTAIDIPPKNSRIACIEIWPRMHFLDLYVLWRQLICTLLGWCACWVFVSINHCASIAGSLTRIKPWIKQMIAHYGISVHPPLWAWFWGCLARSYLDYCKIWLISVYVKGMLYVPNKGCALKEDSHSH